MLRVGKPTQPGEESCYFTYQTWMESGNEDADTTEFRKPKGMKRKKEDEWKWRSMVEYVESTISSMLVFLRWFLDVTWKQVCKWLSLWLDVFLFGWVWRGGTDEGFLKESGESRDLEQGHDLCELYMKDSIQSVGGWKHWTKTMCYVQQKNKTCFVRRVITLVETLDVTPKLSEVRPF